MITPTDIRRALSDLPRRLSVREHGETVAVHEQGRLVCRIGLRSGELRCADAVRCDSGVLGALQTVGVRTRDYEEVCGE